MKEAQQIVTKPVQKFEFDYNGQINAHKKLCRTAQGRRTRTKCWRQLRILKSLKKYLTGWKSFFKGQQQQEAFCLLSRLLFAPNGKSGIQSWFCAASHRRFPKIIHISNHSLAVTSECTFSLMFLQKENAKHQWSV